MFIAEECFAPLSTMNFLESPVLKIWFSMVKARTGREEIENYGQNFEYTPKTWNFPTKKIRQDPSPCYRRWVKTILLIDGQVVKIPSLQAILRGCLHMGGQRAQRWPPAGPPKCAHLSPEGGFGQNFRDFWIFTGSDFELSRSDFQNIWAQLLKSAFTCENLKFSLNLMNFHQFYDFLRHESNLGAVQSFHPEFSGSSRVENMIQHD